MLFFSLSTSEGCVLAVSKRIVGSTISVDFLDTLFNYTTLLWQLSAPSCKHPIPASTIVLLWLEVGKQLGEWWNACT